MLKNILANFLGRFWSVLSNFLFIPLYIKYLGFESYSIISFTLVVAGLMAVMDAGLTSTLSREFARSDRTTLEKVRIFKTLESSYFILIGLSIIIIVAISGTISNKWLQLNTFEPKRVSYLLKIISFDVGFQLLLRFYLGGLLGLEKQVKANIYQVGWGILRNGLVVIGILIVPTLELFFLWQTISTIIFTILIGLSLRKTLTNQHKFAFNPKIEKIVFENIWRFAGSMLLISLVASLNTQMDKLAISKFLPVENLGYYTLAVSLSMVIITIVNPISIALLPRFTTLYSSGKKEEATILFHKINLFVSILVFSVMANVAFFAKELIWIWTGNIELAKNTYSLVPVLAFAYSMLSLQIIPYNIAIANGYTKLYVVLGFAFLCLTLPGYWFATMSLGSIGSAYIFCGVQTVSTFVFLYFINKKFINAKLISKLYIEQILLPLLISLFIAFGFSFMPNWVLQSRINSLFWITIASFTTFIITVLILVSNKDLKQTLSHNSIFKLTKR